MDPRTGREFNYINPQDDPHLYPGGFAEHGLVKRRNPPNVVGMNVGYAKMTLGRYDFTLRVVKEDGVSMITTQEIDLNRLNVEVEKGIIISRGYLG